MTSNEDRDKCEYIVKEEHRHVIIRYFEEKFEEIFSSMEEVVMTLPSDLAV